VRKQRLALTQFSTEIAASSGIDVGRLNLEFLLIFSLTILLCLKFLGALLAGALLMIPAATGRRMAGSLNSFLKYSTLAGAAAVMAGLFFAVKFRATESSGPAIVLSAVALFAAASLFHREHD
jgi:zinc transport system permease protein